VPEIRAGQAKACPVSFHLVFTLKNSLKATDEPGAASRNQSEKVKRKKDKGRGM